MKRLLIIGYVWPEPNSSAAGRRMLELIEFFIREGFSATFGTTAAETPYMADLEGMGVQTEAIELNNDSFDVFVKQLDPDIVLFDRFMMEEQFGWRVAENCPQALRILDTEDLHFLRKARQNALKNHLAPSPSLLQSDLAKREIASIYRSDISLIISEAEIKVLTEDFKVPSDVLFYLPLILKSASKPPLDLPIFEERRYFVSIGNFLHEPNWDAVLQLKEKIWPRIRKELPEVELHVYGAYPSQKVFQLHDEKNGFLIKGRAASAEEVLRNARVLLAPLRFGAGIKGKFLNAMEMGTPSITTAMGAEGMQGDMEWSGHIEDDPQHFSTAAITLYQDREKWLQGQRNGFRLLREGFNAELSSKAFSEKIIWLQKRLGEHRENNFTGAMLLHHRVNSTKYLSRYIQMKNDFQKKDLDRG